MAENKNLNEDQVLNLNKQRLLWERRLKELRSVGVAALDRDFVRRNIEKCENEIEKITAILNS